MSKQLDWKSKLSAALESAHENAAPLTTKARLKSIWPQVLRLMEEGYPYAQIVGGRYAWLPLGSEQPGKVGTAEEVCVEFRKYGRCVSDWEVG